MIKSSTKFHTWFKILLWLITGIALILILMLLMLPRAISSEKFKLWLEKTIETSLNRPVQIETLQWRWTKGVLLENWILADSPAFSKDPLAAVTRMRINLKYRDLLQARVTVEIELDGAQLNLIRQTNGQTNIEALLANVTSGNAPPPPPSPHDPSFGLVLPVDIKTRVQITNVTIRAVDQQQQRTVRCSAGRFILDMPSLFNAPIILEMATELELNQRRITAPFLTARMADLFNAEGELQPAQATIDLKGSFPGVRLSAEGQSAHLRTKLEIDLSKMFEVAAPFLPSPIAATELGGGIHLTTEMRGASQKKLAFKSTLSMDQVKVAGGVLDTKNIGPLKFQLISNGKINLNEGTVTVDTGQVLIQKNSRINWRLGGKKITQADPEISLTLSPVSLDLTELTGLAQDFFPNDVVLDFRKSKQAATLKIAKMNFSGKPLSGPYALRMKDLSLKIPTVRVKAADNDVIARNLSLTVNNIRSDARTLIPNSMGLDGKLHIDQLHLKQPEDIQVSALEIPSLAILLKDLQSNPKALLGMVGRISVNQSMSWKKLIFSPLARIDDFHQTLAADLSLSPDAFADVQIKRLALKSPKTQIQHPDLGTLNTDFQLDTTLNNLRIDALEPLKADLGKLTSHLSVGDFLMGNIEAQAQNLGLSGLQSHGRIQLDLNQLANQILVGLKPGWNHNLKLDGNVNASWEISGRRPHPEELEALLNETTSPMALIKNSAFIKKLYLSVGLDQLGVDAPLDKDTHIAVQQISTDKPFVFTMTNGLKKLNMDGALQIGRINTLPNLGRLKQPLALELTFSGGLHDLKSLHITQNLRVPPVKLTQAFGLKLNGVDRILMKNGRRAPVPAIFTHGEGKLQGQLSIGKDADFPFSSDFFFNGDLKAGATLRLVPGSRVSAKTWLNTTGLDARLGNFLKINDMESRLNFTKIYRLVQDQGQASDSDTTIPLSQAVLKPPRKPRVLANPLSRQLQDDVKLRYGRSHTLKIGSAEVNLAPPNVKFKHQTMDLYLDNGLPQMDFLQMDLLGGTLIGAWSISRSTNGFILNLQGAFSGLDTQDLLPDTARQSQYTETEISGQVALSLPLSSQSDRVLQGMVLNLELTQIGAQALERALYALDPTESDESIVNQRRQLQLGTPRWVDLEIQYGNLSINGEVEAKGVRLAIPPIQGVNIATLPGLEKLEDTLANLHPILALLQKASATTLAIDPGGKLRFLD